MLPRKSLLTTIAVASLSFALLGADAPTSQPAESKTVTPSGLTIIEKGQDTGDAAVAAPNDTVWVEYEGRLTDGTVFDASARHPDSPLIFAIGQHKVIAGWDEGIAGMKVGQKRQLVIPPSLGYGNQDQGPIPANSTLIFDVKLIGLKKAG
jgi:FKBP-type peptidyl-prolyl cis-trans isomerase